VTERASDIGEFGLIDRLLARLGAPREGVFVGPGDDAAAVRLGGATALATTDLILEGVHFEVGLSSPADVGWKALAASISDIAAMAGQPRFALIALGAHQATPVSTLEEIYAGIDECARAFSVAIVGGDTVRAERLIVSVALVGEPGPAGVITRGGARAEDVVCVTGTVGGAAAGLAILRAASDDPNASRLLERHPDLAAAHRRPTPRVREGIAAATGGAAAMIDISDGLAQDVAHVCEASHTGVRLRAEALPLADGVGEIAQWLGQDSVELAAGGGDDYELAIAIAPDRVSVLATAIAPTPLTVIGDVVEGSERVLEREDGTATELTKLGWGHFEEGE
jgi:thiamine-monophosphate kinase